jgi:hypothetical protein
MGLQVDRRGFTLGSFVMNRRQRAQADSVMAEVILTDCGQSSCKIWNRDTPRATAADSRGDAVKLTVIHAYQ